MPPQVTVVVPTLDGGRYLAESLRSALQQSLDLEVIVVRAASDTEAPAVVGSTEFASVEVIDSPLDAPGACRNLGLAAASGAWVYFHDHDDLIYPGALAHLSGLAEQHTLDIAGGRTVPVAEQTRLSSLPPPRSGRFHLSTWRDVARDAATGSMRAPGAMSSIYRRDTLAGVRWPEDCFIHGELFFEIDAFRFARRAGVTTAPVRAYRQHHSQANRASGAGPFFEEYTAFVEYASRIPELVSHRSKLLGRLDMVATLVAYEAGDAARVGTLAMHALRHDMTLLRDPRWWSAMAHSVRRGRIGAWLGGDGHQSRRSAGR